MKRTTHTPRWLVTWLAVLLGMAVGPTAALAEDRPAPAYGVNQGRGASPAGILSMGQGRHDGLLSRPAPAHSLAARSASVVNLTRDETAAPRPAVEPVAAPAAQTPTVQGGFDWLSAAIGIAIGFGAAVLVGLALLANSRRRGTLQGI